MEVLTKPFFILVKMLLSVIFSRPLITTFPSIWCLCVREILSPRDISGEQRGGVQGGGSVGASNQSFVATASDVTKLRNAPSAGGGREGGGGARRGREIKFSLVSFERLGRVSEEGPSGK
jgi:hypothetical protein